MTASPERLGKIVDAQKNPSANTPRIIWYEYARKKIAEFFAGGCVDEAIFENEVVRLRRQLNGLLRDDPRRTRIQGNIDAMDSFLRMYHLLEMEGLRFKPSERRLPTLDVCRVHISVCPELIVWTRTWEIVGCLKLYITKNDRLREEEGDLLKAVLYHYADRYLKRSHPISPEACVVIDVFGQRLLRASDGAALQTGKLDWLCDRVWRTWEATPERSANNTATNRFDAEQFSFTI